MQIILHIVNVVSLVSHATMEATFMQMCSGVSAER